MEEWRDYKVLDFRCAIAVKTCAQAVEKYGILQATAGTIVDHAEMLVLVTPATRELRFPHADAPEARGSSGSLVRPSCVTSTVTGETMLGT